MRKRYPRLDPGQVKRAHNASIRERLGLDPRAPTETPEDVGEMHVRRSDPVNVDDKKDSNGQKRSIHHGQGHGHPRGRRD